jgi:hypothetical protein
MKRFGSKRSNIENLDSPIHKVIAYRLNAPNPHNTQAWNIKIFPQ